KLAWAAPQTYTTNIPSAHRNVSQYKYLAIRAAKKVSGPPTAGPGVALFINIEDGAGRAGLVAARSDEFDPIPHPYQRSGGVVWELLESGPAEGRADPATVLHQE